MPNLLCHSHGVVAVIGRVAYVDQGQNASRWDIELVLVLSGKVLIPLFSSLYLTTFEAVSMHGSWSASSTSRYRYRLSWKVSQYLG